jgi:hypothetical protein
MGRPPGSDSGRSIFGGPPRTAGSRGSVRELAGRWFVQSAQAASANCGSQARLPWPESRAGRLRSQRVSRRWLMHLLLKAAPRSVRPQPLVDRRHTLAGALQVRRCRERAPKVWPAASTSAARPAVSANESTPPFSAVSRIPTRVSTATSSAPRLAPRCHCADSAERAVGGSAPPAALRPRPSRPSSATPVTITLDRYGHLFPGSEKEAADSSIATSNGPSEGLPREGALHKSGP